jgi:archaellum component FlaC
MADDTVKDTIDGLNNLGTQANAVSDMLGKFFDTTFQNLDKSNIKVSDIGKLFGSLGDKIQRSAEQVKVLGADRGLEGLEQPLDRLLGSFVRLEEVVDQSNAFEQFAYNAGKDINMVSGNLSSLQKIMETLHIPGAANIINLSEGFLANAQEAETLNNSFISLSASGGELNKIFDDSGNLKNITALTAAYSNSVANAADVTGLSVHQSMEFANALKTIPGVMDETITTNKDADTVTTSLIATMQTMTGTGRSQSDVINALNESYDNLSTSQGKITKGAQTGAEFLATVSSIANGLNLRFDDVRKTMDSVAEQFRFVGNETDGAAKVLGRYTDALRETGLTSKASGDIIKDMIQNISGLTTGTKAFLSLQSGGPGGLQGSFQIDQLLRNGKLDQVVQMAEKSLKQQFGGRIYNQSEAAASPEAASQFMRQRQLLQSGAFGIGKGLGDDQATRLLEALGKGDIGAATKEIKTGNDALAAVTRQGTDIQKDNNNELKIANRVLERNAIAAEISAGAALKGLFGTSGGNALSINNQIKDANGRAGLQNTQRIGIETGKAGAGEATEQIIELARVAIDNAVKSGKGVVEGGKSSAKNVMNAGDALGKILKEIGSSGVGAPVGPALSRPTATAQSLAQQQIAQHAPISALNAIRVSEADKVANSDKKSEKSQQDRLVIEVVAPPGFTTKTISKPKDIDVNHMINRGGAGVNPGGSGN